MSSKLRNARCHPSVFTEALDQYNCPTFPTLGSWIPDHFCACILFDRALRHLVSLSSEGIRILVPGSCMRSIFVSPMRSLSPLIDTTIHDSQLTTPDIVLHLSSPSQLRGRCCCIPCPASGHFPELALREALPAEIK